MGKARQAARGDALRDELPADLRPELLKALHILTREGTLNADSRRKLKQVLHLMNLLEPAMQQVMGTEGAPVVVDCGAGKGYLGFLLGERFMRPAGRGTVINIESRPELCSRARELARALGLPSVEFVEGRVAEVPPLPRVDLLTALHACDTATDDALVLAVTSGASHVALVPCCQAEVARQLKEQHGGTDAFHLMHAHPIHRRELGAHLTNVVRALVLEACGYQVTVTELVGWEHSLKNELILARKVQKDTRVPAAQLGALLKASGVYPSAVRILVERGAMTDPRTA